MSVHVLGMGFLNGPPARGVSAVGTADVSVARAAMRVVERSIMAGCVGWKCDAVRKIDCSDRSC